jgi:hypothetical protein
MFCTLRLVFDGTKGVAFLCHVSRVRIRFRRYRGRRVPFSCFAHPDSFSAVPWAWGRVFMFCVPKLVFSCVECVGSLFHVLCARAHFRRYRGRQVVFSCFVRSDSFSTVPWTSGPVFMFCRSEIIFGGTEGVGSRCQVLRSRTRFRWGRVRQVEFSCFAHPDSFLTVPSALGPVFMFCALGLVFDGTEGVAFVFHVSRVRIHFRRYRGRRIMFSCLARSDTFSAVSRASGPVFMSYGSGIVFDGTEGVGSRFHVLRARTLFWLYRGRQIPFSYFALPDLFSAVSSVSGLVVMFCAPGPVFSGVE